MPGHFLIILDPEAVTVSEHFSTYCTFRLACALPSPCSNKAFYHYDHLWWGSCPPSSPSLASLSIFVACCLLLADDGPPHAHSPTYVIRPSTVAIKWVNFKWPGISDMIQYWDLCGNVWILNFWVSYTLWILSMVLDDRCGKFCVYDLILFR